MLRCVLSRALTLAVIIGVYFGHADAADVLVPHQGRLLDASDTPITGTRNIAYSIYDAPTGGAPLWSELHVAANIQNGLFDAMLGSVTPLSTDVFRSGGSGGGGGGAGGFLARYLEISVDGVVLSPRLRFGSLPSAVVSSGVSGDFESSPGQVTMGDSASGYYATFGEKVNQGLHAAGSALASGASLISSDCDDDDASLLVRHSQGVFSNMLHMHARTDSAGLSSSFSDPTVETGMSQSSTADGSSLSLSTVDNSMPNRISMNVTVPKQSSRLSLVTDLGDDGVEDYSVALSSDLTSARLAIKTKGTGADANRVLAIQNGATPDQLTSVSSIDDDGDTVPESEISQIVTPTTCGVAINTKGTGAAKGRTIGSSCDDSSAVQVLELDDDGDGIVEGRGIVSVKSASGSGSMSASGRLTCDPNEDGVPDAEISQMVTPTTSNVAIKTKGTGADKNRVISSTCDDSTARQVIGIDDDGDGVPDNGIEQVASEVDFRYKIDHKRTSTGQSGATSGTISPDSVVTRSGVDISGDGNPESEISQSVLPTTSSMAINRKGTGADKNRTIGSSCDDSSAVQVLELDDDGDGIVEGRGIISVKSATGTGSMSASSRLMCDSDDDGAQESTVESSCDATSAKIIVDRDSGRSKGFMRAVETGSSVTLENDLNFDGLVDRSVVSSIDSAQAEVVASEGTTQVSMKVRKGGVIKGSLNINHGGAMRVDFDGDGNGYLSNSLGIGVTATHAVDIAGGAYCDGTNWVNASDKNAKENFEQIDGEELLVKIADLDITRWNYKGDDAAKHIGPTAQDFKKTFGVGSDDKSISTIDPSGIALAAIKELYVQLKHKDAQLSTQSKQIEELQERLNQLAKELKKR